MFRGAPRGFFAARGFFLPVCDLCDPGSLAVIYISFYTADSRVCLTPRTTLRGPLRMVARGSARARLVRL